MFSAEDLDFNACHISFPPFEVCEALHLIAIEKINEKHSQYSDAFCAWDPAALDQRKELATLIAICYRTDVILKKGTYITLRNSLEPRMVRYLSQLEDKVNIDGFAKYSAD